MREVNFELNGQKRTVMIRVSQSPLRFSAVSQDLIVSGRECGHPDHQEDQGGPQQTSTCEIPDLTPIILNNLSFRSELR